MQQFLGGSTMMVCASVLIQPFADAVMWTRVTTVEPLVSREAGKPAKLGLLKLLILMIILLPILELELLVDITIAVIRAVIVVEHGATPPMQIHSGNIATFRCAHLTESLVTGGTISHTTIILVLTQLQRQPRQLTPSVSNLTSNLPKVTVMSIIVVVHYTATMVLQTQSLLVEPTGTVFRVERVAKWWITHQELIEVVHMPLAGSPAGTQAFRTALSAARYVSTGQAPAHGPGISKLLPAPTTTFTNCQLPQRAICDMLVQIESLTSLNC